MDENGSANAHFAGWRLHGGPSAEEVEVNHQEDDSRRINQQREKIILSKRLRTETEAEGHPGPVDSTYVELDVPKTRIFIHPGAPSDQKIKSFQEMAKNHGQVQQSPLPGAAGRHRYQTSAASSSSQEVDAVDKRAQ